MKKLLLYFSLVVIALTGCTPQQPELSLNEMQIKETQLNLLNLQNARNQNLAITLGTNINNGYRFTLSDGSEIDIINTYEEIAFDNLTQGGGSNNSASSTPIPLARIIKIQERQSDYTFIFSDAAVIRLNKGTLAVTGMQRLTKISTENRFATGDKIILDPDDASKVSAIVRTTSATKDKSLIDSITSYYFEFAGTPANTISFYLDLPYASNHTVVSAIDQDDWSDCQSEPLPAGGQHIYHRMKYTPMKSTTSTVEAIRVALFNKKNVVTSYKYVSDPSGYNPLAGIATVTCPVDVATRITIKGQDNNDIVKDFSVGKNHTIPVYGLYPNYDNDVRITLTTSSGIRYSLVEHPHPYVPYLNNARIKTSMIDGFRNNPDQIYVVNTDNESMGQDPEVSDIILGYDQWGKVRFVDLENNRQFFALKLKGKNIYGTLNFNNIVDLKDYAGNLVQRITIKDPSITYLHHEIIVIDDNTLAVAYAVGENDECGIFEINLTTGEYTNVIDLRKHLGNDRMIVGGVQNNDPIHINSIDYSESDNCYVISGRRQGIVKIHRTTHELKWIITPHLELTASPGIDLTNKVLRAVNFDGSNPDQWCIAQHTATILPNGDIMTFDNHNPIVGKPLERGRASHITQYRVDEKNMTISKVWDYAHPENKYAPFKSSAFMLENGNILGAWMPQEAFVCEIEPKTKKIVWQSDIKSVDASGIFSYRCYKIGLYE